MFGKYSKDQKAREQLIEGLGKLGFDVVEVEETNNGLRCFPQQTGNMIFLDLELVFSEEAKQKLGHMLNLEAILIGWIEDKDDMISDKGVLASAYFTSLSFNEVAHLKAKLINIETEDVIWSGDGYDISSTMRRAIHNATKQVLGLLEEDIKEIRR